MIDEKTIFDFSYEPLLSSNLIKLCDCALCQKTRYISYINSFRVVGTEYFMLVREFSLKDRYHKVSFYLGCWRDSDKKISGSQVAQELMDNGIESVAYHLDIFR